MLNFKNFLIEEAPSRFLSIGGQKGARHAYNYVRPFLNSDETMELGTAHEGIKAGSKVKVVGQQIINNKHYTDVVHPDTGETTTVPNSKLLKDPKLIKKRGERGFGKENELAEILKKDGLMRSDVKTAGSTGGHDFHVITKKGDLIGGEERENIKHEELGGESKIDLGAKFGSVFLSHTPEKGWHVTDKNRSKKPRFADAVENATVTVDGKPKPLLQHLNDTWGDPSGGKHLKNVTSDTSDDAPAQAYFSDHGAHILHVHSHGTYRVGDSHDEDAHNTQLPTISGMTGRFTVGRERKGGGVQISFRPHKGSLKKSSVDIMKDEDRKVFARNMGVTPSVATSSDTPVSTTPVKTPPRPASSNWTRNTPPGMTRSKPRSLSIGTANLESSDQQPSPPRNVTPRVPGTQTVGGKEWKSI